MKVLARVVMTAAVAFAMSAAIAQAASPSPVPSKVTLLKATAGDEQVTVSWSSPTTGKPITSYTLTGSPGGYVSTDPSTSRTVTNLTNGTLYTFKVYPRNAVGVGPTSTATATPHATPPSAPTNLGATQGPGQGQITISWTPPISTGSSPPGSPTPTIDHYTVTVSPGGISVQTNSGTTTYIASNLADNVTYKFSVTATNSRPVTGPAATVFAPLPTGATIGLQPTAGVAGSSITAAGQLFLKNESITLYWDVPSHVAASVVTDDNGAFTRVVKPYAGDQPKVHKLCASVPPKPCANFTLRAPPKPTPTPSASPSPSPEAPTPSPSEIPPASGTRPGGGLSGLDIITRPPFVFLPIVGILGLLGVLAYWALAGRRRPPPPNSAATVTHLATRPDYMAPFPPAVGPPAAPPAAAPPPPLEPPAHPPLPAAGPSPIVPPQPMPPAAPPPPVEWPDPPATPDEPPDLPQPSE